MKAIPVSYSEPPAAAILLSLKWKQYKVDLLQSMLKYWPFEGCDILVNVIFVWNITQQYGYLAKSVRFAAF
jgi:hypothetical protein